MPPEETILSAAPAAPDTGIVQSQTVEPPAAAAPASAPAVVAAPAVPLTFDKVIGPDGTLSDNWRDLLPETIRGEKSLDSIKNLNVLAQSYVHAQRAIGANKVAIPGPNATPEEIDAFQRSLGRPETADGYQLEIPKDLPEGLVYSDENMKAFREFAFQKGWSQQQAADAVAFQRQILEKQYQEQTAAAEAEYAQTETKLRTEYGDRFDATIAQCNKAVETFGVGEVLKNAGLLNNYEVIKMFARIGESLSESRLKQPEATVQPNAQSRYEELYNNPESAYWKQDHPGHAAAVAEVTQLVKILKK
nr:MAG TPA: putative protease [Caudoviricetes sp.]